MQEKYLLNQILTRVSLIGARLFRNNCGAVEDKTGRWHRFGICNPGGSDLIGWTPVTVTQEMVGRTVAIFTAVEAKFGSTATTPQQTNFIDRVQADGGYAGIARTAEDAVRICGG